MAAWSVPAALTSTSYEDSEATLRVALALARHRSPRGVGRCGSPLGADVLTGGDREVLVCSPRVDVVGAPQVDHQAMVVGAARLLTAAQPRAAAAFAGRSLVCGQLLDAGALNFRKALHGLLA